MDNQIRLWESDINRIQATEAVLYEYFASEEAFSAALEYSKKQGFDLWNDGKSKIIVRRSGSPLSGGP